LAIAIVMTILVFLQVVLRYIFNTGYPGIEEISLICMMWIAFFGGSLLFADQSGISVTIFVERLTPGKYRWAKLLFHVLTIIFLCLLIWYGYKFALVGKRMMFGASQISKYWSYISIPVGSAFSLIFELNHLTKTLKSEPINFLGENTRPYAEEGLE
jgi:TRAP-type C4-dicarboxylate transport system permease small subunit